MGAYMQSSKAGFRYRIAPGKIRAKPALRSREVSLAQLNRSGDISAAQSKVSLRIKSASNSRYSSPAQPLSFTLSQSLLTKPHHKTRSENVTPKRPSPQEDTKVMGHRRNLSLELKPKTLGKSVSEAKLMGRKGGGSLHVSPMKDAPAAEDLALEQEQLVQYIDEFYRLRKALPPTTSFYYKFLKVIGKGAFGKVSLAVHKLSGRFVAVKSLDKAYLKEERTKLKVLQEVSNMHSIRHPRVVRLLEVFESSKHFNMVMEFCSGGDLLQYVKSKGKLEEEEAKGIFAQAVESVKACQEQGIIHRDVKLDNILLSSSSQTAKLCDFGVSRLAKRGQRITDQCGTPAYLAPEIIANQGYDGFYVDLWSLGVLLYAMVVGAVPFRAGTLADLHKVILRGKYALPDELSSSVKDLIDALLQLIPQKRLSLDGVLRHPWLADCRVSRFSRAREKVNKAVLARLGKWGIPGELVERCLQANEINHGTATYELLLLCEDST